MSCGRGWAEEQEDKKLEEARKSRAPRLQEPATPLRAPAPFKVGDRVICDDLCDRRTKGKIGIVVQVDEDDPDGMYRVDYAGRIQWEAATHVKPVAPPAPSTKHAARKARPMARGLLAYFPDALAEVANVSRVGNEQHHPGKPIHWEKEKSTDHADCLVRHLTDAGTLDTDGLSHTAKVAWRALALLQTELEAADPALAEKRQAQRDRAAKCPA